MSAWTVEASERLDSFLASGGRMLSRAKAQKAIVAGLVRVNGKVIKREAHKVQTGDMVKVTGELPTSDAGIEPIDLKLSVLYEDDACFVLQKPAGVSVHPGAGMKKDEVTLLSGIAYLFKKHSLLFSAQSVLVHRLDKETTGCILVAKSGAAHLALQKQFQDRTIEKKYLALVAGVLPQKIARVDSPIARSAHDRTRMSVRGVGKTREAQTTYRVLAETQNASLVECDLHTGRTHQVRVHLSSIGHPVLGDGTYATPSSSRVSEESGITSLCLHAWKLGFHSPADRERHIIACPLPALFEKAAKKLGLD